MKKQVCSLTILIVYLLLSSNIQTSLSLQTEVKNSKLATMLNKSKEKLATEVKGDEVAAYNMLPEYMANFFGQGHELDCLNRCKKCVKDSMVSKVYYVIKEKNKLDFVPKDLLIESINNELASIKRTDEKEYKSIVTEKNEFTEEELNPKNLFRIYFDQCFLYNNAFYS